MRIQPKTFWHLKIKRGRAEVHDVLLACGRKGYEWEHLLRGGHYAKHFTVISLVSTTILRSIDR
jgi:hypothetical protein